MNYVLFSAASVLLCSCSVSKRINRSAQHLVQQQPLNTAHVGISIMDAATQQFVYNYQGDKYFVPASNTKLFTCYAAMKYLGDSLPGLRYAEDVQAIYAQPTADPTLLSPDFKQHPVMDFLQGSNKKIVLGSSQWQDHAFGYGWTWDDYEASYMAERSPMPVYGNITVWKGRTALPALFTDSVVYATNSTQNKYSLHRSRNSNLFYTVASQQAFTADAIPFVTNGLQGTAAILNQQLNGRVTVQPQLPAGATKLIHSQPTDSLLKITMHRSDNFFAEQTLLMVSNEKLGVMSDARIIDTLLKTDLNDLPQRPKWVDGSGLSRYNLFSPQDLVTVLNKIKQSFGFNRISAILPTGNTGTLGGYYPKLQGAIFAKTGTLSNNLALSGYLVTKKHKTYIFSIIVNNHMGQASAIRHLIETFLTGIYEKY
ncbi:D-alanyl-D-alanine carboxypeptidase/D-alanyl-D-alanine-endopeptidase [Deminuibacter soli]|nr:D-alanyl-D-alanine carboxypeptidase [Deminuibacter soli]